MDIKEDVASAIAGINATVISKQAGDLRVHKKDVSDLKELVQGIMKGTAEPRDNDIPGKGRTHKEAPVGDQQRRNGPSKNCKVVIIPSSSQPVEKTKEDIRGLIDPENLKVVVMDLKLKQKGMAIIALDSEANKKRKKMADGMNEEIKYKIREPKLNQEAASRTKSRK